MVEWVAKTCPICGVSYCLDKVFDEYRRDGAKEDNGSPKGWHCPNGHFLIYKESEATKLRRECNVLKQQTARLEDEKREALEKAKRAEAATKKLQKRTAAGTCPCCQRSFSNMAEHMKHQHPEFVSGTGAKVVPIKREKKVAGDQQ